MGLYLCIFDGDEELDGVEVGLYEDFGMFRDAVRELLEDGVNGARFPVLMEHVDADGSWTPEEAGTLVDELTTIYNEFSQLPPAPLPEGWKADLAESFELSPKTLADCFFDVDGESLLLRLIRLAEQSKQRRLAILFQ